MRFTPQQDRALCAAGRWLRDGGDQIFRLFGYAGTGKTTLAKYLAEHVDGGGRLELGSYGSSRVIPLKAITLAELAATNQVLVGRDVTRHWLNDRLRSHLEFYGAIPQPSERLICLRNNHTRGLLNGSTWITRAARAGEQDSILLTITSDDAPNSVTHTKTHLAFFRGTANKELRYFERREFDEFDFGYAITTHKAQGSQWLNVVLFDESKVFKQDAARWLYTAITRACDTVTVVIPDVR